MFNRANTNQPQSQPIGHIQDPLFNAFGVTTLDLINNE